MDGELLLAKCIKVIIDKRATNLCRHVGQHLVDLGDVIASPDAKEFKHRFVILERHDGLATFTINQSISTPNLRSIGDGNTHCRET
jgi:hypothetical protein